MLIIKLSLTKTKSYRSSAKLFKSNKDVFYCVNNFHLFKYSFNNFIAFFNFETLKMFVVRYALIHNVQNVQYNLVVLFFRWSEYVHY